MTNEEVKDFIRNTMNLALNDDDKLMYEFISSKLDDLSQLFYLMAQEELSESHLIVLGQMLKMITNCVDIRIDQLTDLNKNIK